MQESAIAWAFGELEANKDSNLNRRTLMKNLVALLAALMFVPAVQAADSEGAISADHPRTYESSIRVIPSFGTAAFSSGEVDLDAIGDQTAGGLFVDFGDGWLVG